MPKKSNNAHQKDSIQSVTEKNEKLLRKVSRLERDVKKLRSENGTLEDAWKKTEEYLLFVTKDKSLKEIFHELDKQPLRKINKSCSNCSSNKMKRIQFDGFYVIVCEKCKYRNRVDEKGSG